MIMHLKLEPLMLFHTYIHIPGFSMLFHTYQGLADHYALLAVQAGCCPWLTCLVECQVLQGVGRLLQG